MTTASPPVTNRVAVQSPRQPLRDSLVRSLGSAPDLAVVGKVAHPDELPGLCDLAQPDIVILDAGPRLSEFAVFAGSLLRCFPGLRVIMIYRDALEQDLALACRAGVTSLVPESRGLPGVLALASLPG